MLSLVMNPGLAEEQSFPLAVGTATIGRTNDNPIVCTHKSLSRRHAQVDFDGARVRVADLQSKNGIFFKGKRVPTCELVEGDSFRCGDVTFLVEGETVRARISVSVKTLPSPLAQEGAARIAPQVALPAVRVEGDPRHRDKLFLLIRASELLVAPLPLERMLHELLALTVQVLEVDRVAVLALDETSHEMRPKAVKTIAYAPTRPYSKRVVDWVVEHGSATSFADLSSDTTLPGDAREDAQVRSAMAIPIHPGGGLFGVLYADSLSRADALGPDDLALFRALANMVAVAMDANALRHPSRGQSAPAVTKLSR